MTQEKGRPQGGGTGEQELLAVGAWVRELETHNSPRSEC